MNEKVFIVSQRVSQFARESVTYGKVTYIIRYGAVLIGAADYH